MEKRALASILICFSVVGCQNFGAVPGLAPVAVVEAPVIKTLSPSAKLARDQFASGNFALAARSFQEAVERTPADFDSWVGLAAAYDKLGRFDLADRAYTQAIQIGGETIEVVNNRGYSFMLRGDRIRAREQFEYALQLDPENPVIVNNIRLLSDNRTSVRGRIQ